MFFFKLLDSSTATLSAPNKPALLIKCRMRMDQYGRTLYQNLEGSLKVFKLAELYGHPVRSAFLRGIPEDLFAITVAGNIRRQKILCRVF